MVCDHVSCALRGYGPDFRKSGPFASLRSVQGAAPLAPLCGYPCALAGKVHPLCVCTFPARLPNAYQLVAICYALDLDVDVSYFVGDYAPLLNQEGLEKVRIYRDDLIASGRYRPPTKTAAVIKYVEKPVSNLPVSAGVGEFLDDSHFEMVSFPENSVPEGAEFGIRISGNSMEPVYHDGQIVWVQKCDHLSVGEVGIFIYDGEGYLKMYSEQEPDEESADSFTDSYGCVHPQPVLISYNQAYEPKIIRAEAAFQIVGRVL